MNSSLIRVLSKNTRLLNYLNRRKVSKYDSNKYRTLHYMIQQRQFSNQISKEVYLIDENENIERPQKIVNKINKYTERSFTCGELRLEHVASKVTICGWLEFQRMGKFLVLRDGYGQTQCIIDEKDEATQKQLESLAYESILKVEGAVVARPKNMVNKKQATGEIEVLISKLTVLNEVKHNLPFNIREFQKAKESLRMQYRYLDMRFPQTQRYMRVRSEVTNKMREFLVKHAGFIDVETPTLFKKTPGGAQEFVVPTRFPNLFYSLVQSPQQFKQMLMAGAIDRYFQVARCYRDETSRPDRQPEFTQLDIEMSFTNMEGVMELIEDLLQYIWPSFLQPLPFKFPRIQYKDAMELYGTDQPDVRYDYKIKNCTEILKRSPKFADTKNFYAGCLVFEEPYVNLPKSLREKLLINQYPDTNLVLNKISDVDEFIKKTTNLFTEPVMKKFCEELNINKNSVLFLVYGKKMNALKRLGKLREDYVNHLEENNFKIKKEGMHILWIVDYPLFEEGNEPGSVCSTHHPFTAPNCDDLHLLTTSPFEVRGQSYDLVLNGNEIAGGSMRIHNSSLQKNVLDMLKIESKYLQHMLDMLDSGCPPHGGIALGLDRLFSIMLNTPSIRDVIAFPKTFEGKDPLSGAPSPISDEDKKLYHIFK